MTDTKIPTPFSATSSEGEARRIEGVPASTSRPSTTTRKTYPWMKFYPSDHRSDPALRSCSLAARGLWMEMLCIMHEAEPCGHLLINGKAINDYKIASLCGCSLDEFVELIAELDDAGVFDRGEDGVFISRRMVRDTEKAAKDKENGKGGGNPKLLKGDNEGVNPPVKGEDKAQKPEARSQKSEEGERKYSPRGESAGAPVPCKASPTFRARGSKSDQIAALQTERADFFDRMWAIMPKRRGDSRKGFLDALAAKLIDGADEARVVAGIEAYAKHEAGCDATYRKGVEAWIEKECWDSDWTQKAEPQKPRNPNSFSRTGKTLPF